MRALLGFIWKQCVSKRKCWARDRESLCSSSRVYVISMLGSASTSWGIPHRLIALVLWLLSLSSYAGHPQIPPGGDTVATSGFLPLPLCFTRDQWTAEFGVHELVTAPSLLAKWWRPHISSSSSKESKNSLFFYFFIVDKVAMIGVKRREWNDVMQCWELMTNDCFSWSIN
jgi:hypothetical protein